MMTMTVEKIDFNKWADFWRNDVGVNVIPAVAKSKKPLVEWKQWQTEAIPQEVHDEWKSKNMFDQGMAVICGRAWHIENVYPIWFNMTDLDNMMGINEFCQRKDGSQGTLDEMAKQTLVEQHANKNKAHIYSYSATPFAPVTSAIGPLKEKCDSNELPAIEVKSGGKFLSYCSPGPHKDNSFIQILETKEIAVVDADRMNFKISEIRKKYGLVHKSESLSSFLKPSITEVVKKDLKIVAGQNRHEAILRYVESLRKKNPGMPRDWYEMNVTYFNQNYTTEPLPDSEIQKILDQGILWMDEILQSQNDEEFRKYNEDGLNGEDEQIVAYWMVTHYITKQKIIEKSEITKKLNSWKSRFNIEIDTKKTIDGVFNDKKIFKEVQEIAYQYGKSDTKITFDKDQTVEVVFWLLGKYRIKRIEITGSLICFNGKRYEEVTEEFISRSARQCLIKSTNNTMKEIHGHIKDRAQVIKNKDIEKHVHLKCLENGIYNIKTGEFSKDFDPDYIILNQIPHDYDEDCTFEGIEKILKTILVDDISRQKFYDFLSTCLHPYTGIDFQLGNLGPPGTGKTQLGKLSEMVLGEDNVSHATIHAISEDPTLQMGIAYNMLNIDGDLSPEDIKQLDVLKKWISQEKFTNRRIYGYAETFRPTTRLMFMANDLYEITNENDAQAIYERTDILKVEQKFRGTDNEIKDVFEGVITTDELNGLITYLLKNATTIYKKQNVAYLTDTVEVKNIWNRFGNWIKQFVDKRTVEGASLQTETKLLFDAWEGYAIEHNCHIKSKTAFYKSFEEITGLERKRTHESTIPKWIYRGVRLLTEKEIGEKQQSKLKEFED